MGYSKEELLNERVFITSIGFARYRTQAAGKKR